MASVERRAFRIAEIATGNRDDALDIVQDTMMALVKNYSDKPPDEWGPIFNRILQSKITDLHRKSSVRDRVKGWLGFSNKEEDEEDDPIQTAPDPRNGNPLKEVTENIATAQLISALKILPSRQRQAFLLRAVEGLSVEETASAMGCTTGSVKTHYSRAISALRIKLEAYW